MAFLGSSLALCCGLGQLTAHAAPPAARSSTFSGRAQVDHASAHLKVTTDASGLRKTTVVVVVDDSKLSPRTDSEIKLALKVPGKLSETVVSGEPGKLDRYRQTSVEPRSIPGLTRTSSSRVRADGKREVTVTLESPDVQVLDVGMHVTPPGYHNAGTLKQIPTTVEE